MKQYLDQLIDWIDSRNNRERLLILGAGLVVIYLLWSFLLLEPLKARKLALNREMITINTQIKKLSEQSEKIIADAKEDEGAEVIERAMQLRQHAKVLNQRLGILTSDLITPEQMISALRLMLVQQPGLVLKSLETSPAEAVKTDAKAQSQIANSGIYRHEITLVLAGDYFSTLNYLKDLENLGWSLFWDSLDYKVTLYPEANVTIKLHTLSNEAGIISG